MATFSKIYDSIEDDISLDYQQVPLTKKDKDSWDSNTTKFIVTINYDYNCLETKYFTPLYPDTKDVFACVVLDARTVHENDFPNFCMEYGYDTDSMKAFNIFKVCKQQYKKLLNLLGDDLFKQFMECEMDW